ncbi:MAG TPA: hypothetical protein VGI16_14585 [Candidatus Acidoferrum sp.]|jgi:hypothetical protein
MKLRWLIGLLGVLALTASATLGHGDEKHVIGTLIKVNADSVVVKTADGKSVEVKLISGTAIVMRDGKAAKLSDLTTGEKVVIHAKPKGDTLEASEVRFSPVPPPVK